MQGIDGYETCKQIKKSEGYSTVPVIFLTGKTNSESINRGFDVGGQGFISKPFNVKELKSRVDTLLKLKVSDDTQ